MTVNTKRPSDGAEQCVPDSAVDASIRIADIPEDEKDYMRQLTQTIETELIPRLLVAFGPSSPESDTDGTAASDSFAPDLDAFVELLLNNGVDAAVNYIADLRSKGYRLQQIYLDLLAPAARELGRMWELDDCNFTDVTVGVTRLHRVLHEYSNSFCAHEGSGRHAALRALIVPVPGEDHIFGQLMVIEFFRRAGWTVWSAAPTSAQEVGTIVADREFDLIGVSASAERHLPAVAETIAAIKSKSSNPGVRIMLGGNIFSQQPDRVKELGADGTASDGQEAVALAFKLVE